MPTSSPEPADGAERLDAQAKEYGEFIATERIMIGGVPAFNVGDPVPISHVERGVVQKEQVVRRNTKAADAVLSPEA